MVAPDEWPTAPPGTSRAHPRSRTAVLVVTPPATRADVRQPAEQLRLLLQHRPADQVICDLGAITAPDALTLETLAWLQLTALELGSGIRLRHACDRLRELLALTGLSAVFPLAG